MIVLLFLILVFLQASFIPVNLVLAAILAYAMIKIEKNFILILFFTGVLFDVLNLRVIGLTSLFYLIVCLALFLYQKKFKSKNLFYILIFGLIVFCLEAWIFNKNISLLKVLLETIALFGWYYLFSLFVSML